MLAIYNFCLWYSLPDITYDYFVYDWTFGRDICIVFFKVLSRWIVILKISFASIFHTFALFHHSHVLNFLNITPSHVIEVIDDLCVVILSGTRVHDSFFAAKLFLSLRILEICDAIDLKTLMLSTICLL